MSPQEIESITTLPMVLPSLVVVEQITAMRKRNDEVVFPNAAFHDVPIFLRVVG